MQQDSKQFFTISPTSKLKSPPRHKTVRSSPASIPRQPLENICRRVENLPLDTCTLPVFIQNVKWLVSLGPLPFSIFSESRIYIYIYRKTIINTGEPSINHSFFVSSPCQRQILRPSRELSRFIDFIIVSQGVLDIFVRASISLTRARFWSWKQNFRMVGFVRFIIFDSRQSFLGSRPIFIVSFYSQPLSSRVFLKISD